MQSDEGADYIPRKVGPLVDYQWIKHCLKQCVEENGELRVQPTPLQFQARVVDISNRSIIVMPPQAEYIALSYVWGGVKQPNARQTGPLPENIPRTIEDAFTIAKNIGIKLVWVDSLCINQEDSTHKMQQIQQMENIYENAYATIIVQDGPDADAPITGVSKPRRKNFEQQICRVNPIESIDKSIWTTRAWTFQEGILSRRCIVFNPGAVHVVWHDRYWQEGRPNHSKNHWRGTLLNPLFLTDPPFEAYSQLFQNYMMRRVTNQQDFLPAIAGLLRRLEEKFFPGGFCFGLPFSHFREALLWEFPLLDSIYVYSYNPIRKPAQERRLRLPGILPTWAWAGWRSKEPVYPLLAEHPESFLHLKNRYHKCSTHLHPPLLLEFNPTNPPQPWSSAGSYLDVQMFDTHGRHWRIGEIYQIYRDSFAKFDPGSRGAYLSTLFTKDTHQVSRESRITRASLSIRPSESALQVTGLIIDLSCLPLRKEYKTPQHELTLGPGDCGCKSKKKDELLLWKQPGRLGSRQFLWLSTHFNKPEDMVLCQGLLLRWRSENLVASRQRRLDLEFRDWEFFSFLEVHPPIAWTFWLE